MSVDSFVSLCPVLSEPPSPYAEIRPSRSDRSDPHRRPQPQEGRGRFCSMITEGCPMSISVSVGRCGGVRADFRASGIPIPGRFGWQPQAQLGDGSMNHVIGRSRLPMSIAIPESCGLEAATHMPSVFTGTLREPESKRGPGWNNRGPEEICGAERPHHSAAGAGWSRRMSSMKIRPAPPCAGALRSPRPR
jgi:hypothetical protein